MRALLFLSIENKLWSWRGGVSGWGHVHAAVAQLVAGWGVAGMGGGISAGGGSAGGDTGGCASQKWQDCSVASVRLHAVGVGLVEKLWMISNAASTVLFPRVAAETEEQRQKEFTPLVAQTVLWTTGLGALALALLSRWIVLLLYSEAFLPAVGALQSLLVGIVALSAWRVLANDIAGRGFPGLNIYTGLAAEPPMWSKPRQ